MYLQNRNKNNVEKTLKTKFDRQRAEKVAMRIIIIVRNFDERK